MGLVAQRVSDKPLLKLIRGYLTAGVLADGLVGPTDEGVPQGGPLTPPTMVQNFPLIWR
jgi:RNA-directed DNA polymerase